MFCEECHRVEGDEIFLDLETCSQCGGYLKACEDEEPTITSIATVIMLTVDKGGA